MANTDTNLADQSGNLFASYKNYDPRIIFFYFVLAAMLLLLGGGLAYQQLFKSETYSEQERVQSQRRIIIPGPRGNIYARDGRTVLVGNRPRFAVVLYLDELKTEFLKEASVVRKNYKESGLKDMPFSKIARVSVVQRYLDQVNRILDRDDKVDPALLTKHFNERLLLPYELVSDLSEHEYARLIERLPVKSPLQVYTFNSRSYPFGSAAAHALGYVRVFDNIDAEDLPGEGLSTSKMKGFVGKSGLEKMYDSELQGDAGGSVIRVDKDGYKVSAIEKQLPIQGKNLVSSIDIDVQLAAEQAIGDQVGAAVAIDIKTGEVLALVSKPDYNLNEMSPRVSTKKYAEIQEQGAELNRAVSGEYPPGSTFKILTTIAGLRRGTITPDDPIIDCDGVLLRYGRKLVCYNGAGHHHDVLLRQAIAESCDIYFYEVGWRTTPAALADEARRFHFGQRTGIDIPDEHRLFVPDDEWKQRTQHEKWYPGDTANMAIGQGFVLVTPLQMACFTASVARGEVFTKPTLLHDPNRPTQRTEPIGLTAAQRLALFEGMEQTTLPPKGTARVMTTMEAIRIPGLRIAAKTGTAQKDVYQDGKKGIINFAWLICFAPVENPQIAIAIVQEGDTIGEEFGGGRNSGPVASAILKKYFEKKNAPVIAAPQILLR